MHIGVHVGVQNTTLDAAVKRLRAQGVPYHMHPGGYGHQLGSVWTAAVLWTLVSMVLLGLEKVS